MNTSTSAIFNAGSTTKNAGVSDIYNSEMKTCMTMLLLACSHNFRLFLLITVAIANITEDMLQFT
jgi:hypothetical protein